MSRVVQHTLPWPQAAAAAVCSLGVSSAQQKIDPAHKVQLTVYHQVLALYLDAPFCAMGKTLYLIATMPGTA